MTNAGKKRCKSCREFFVPFNTLQPTCSPGCAIAWSQTKQGQDHVAKEKRKETRADKQRLNQSRKSWWLDSNNSGSTQYWFNRYIRFRDRAAPCISCGASGHDNALTGGFWDCGHYRSIGACPELRFEPLNAHRQCKQCNRDLSGNAVEYRIRLVSRIGQGKVDWLEGPHEPKHYKIDDLRELRDHFKRLCKELEQQAA